MLVKNLVRLIGDFGSDKISGVDFRKRLNLKSTFVRFKFIEEKKIEKKRQTSDIFNILSELGGLLKSLQVGCFVVVYPVAHFMFLLVMI